MKPVPEIMEYTRLHADISRGVADGSLPELTTRTLTRVAEGGGEPRAVRHPLGFVCFPVLRDGDIGICVHLWTAGSADAVDATDDTDARRSPAFVHCHSWDLLSFVLYGTLHNQLARVIDRPAVPTHRMLEIRTGGLVDEVRATRRLVSWERSTARLVPAGTAYSLVAGQFHTVDVPPAQGAATVVLSRTRSTVPELARGEIGAVDRRIQRQQCSASETARLADIVVRRLEDHRVQRLEAPHVSQPVDLQPVDPRGLSSGLPVAGSR